MMKTRLHPKDFYAPAKSLDCVEKVDIDQEGWSRFLDRLSNPPQPNEALKRLLGSTKD
jgi:uncharacterized protein (DUF1778 family)